MLGDDLGADIDVPRHAAGGRRHGVLGHGGGHQHQGRPAAAALRVVAPAAPLRLPRRRPGPAAPAVDRAGVPASPAATVYWWTLWAAAAAAVLVWRVVLPLWRSARHRLRVVGVVRESADVLSVYLTGRRLDRLPVRAGQFFNFRFLAGRAGPAPTRTRCPRLPTGAAADHRQGGRRRQRRLALLRPGTRVLIEGPYGRLSSRARTQRKVVLIGAGVGITPLRALAEGLEYAPGEAVLLQRYSAEPLFTRELEMLAAERGLQVIWLPGPRRTPSSVLGPAAQRHA